MFHASNILLQSVPFNKNSVTNKFTDLINNLLEQLKTEHFNRTLDSAIKRTPYNARKGLINGMINSRCKAFDLNPPISNGWSKIKKERIKNLTLNEQFYLLAHIDFKSINSKVDKINPEFAGILESIISEHLLQVVDNFTY